MFVSIKTINEGSQKKTPHFQFDYYLGVFVLYHTKTTSK